MISQIVTSPQVEHKVAQAGGTAAYNLTLVNLYNQDYPDFGYPEATLSVHSPDPVSTHRTYLIAKRTLIETLASRQKHAGAPRGHRIVAQVADDSGPIPQTGSRKRALGGLLLLGLVAGGTGWSLTGRGRIRGVRPPGLAPQLVREPVTSPGLACGTTPAGRGRSRSPSSSTAAIRSPACPSHSAGRRGTAGEASASFAAATI